MACSSPAGEESEKLLGLMLPLIQSNGAAEGRGWLAGTLAVVLRAKATIPFSALISFSGCRKGGFEVSGHQITLPMFASSCCEDADSNAWHASSCAHACTFKEIVVRYELGKERRVGTPPITPNQGEETLHRSPPGVHQVLTHPLYERVPLPPPQP